MTGKIVKGIAGFYYVHTEEYGVLECKAKGVFRNRSIKPLVGDDVSVELLNQESLTGNIIEVFPRKNELIRPAVANVNQAVVIFAVVEPEPNLNLLDRFLVMMTKQDVDTIICFNKADLSSDKRLESLEEAYRNCGYRTLFISAKKQSGTAELRELLLGKTTVLAGPSGVGKSTVMNLMQLSLIRAYARSAGFSEVTVRDGRTVLRYDAAARPDGMRLLAVLSEEGDMRLLAGEPPAIEWRDKRANVAEFVKKLPQFLYRLKHCIASEKTV